MQHRYSYTIMLTNQILAVHGSVGTCHSARTKDSTKVHQTLSLLKGGRLHDALDFLKIYTHIRGHFQTIFKKINVIMTLRGEGVRAMTLFLP